MFTKYFHAGFHRTGLVSEWASVALDRPWDIAFVDHDGMRSETCQRLRHAQYVVCHDMNNKGARRWGLAHVNRWFRWRWDCEAFRPRTTVFSNTHDLTDFRI